MFVHSVKTIQQAVQLYLEVCEEQVSLLMGDNEFGSHLGRGLRHEQ